MVIADCLETVEFEDGAAIIKQGALRSGTCGPAHSVAGEVGDSFFFVLSGQVRVLQRVGESQGEVGILGVGDYFGEIALLTSMPRQVGV